MHNKGGKGEKKTSTEAAAKKSVSSPHVRKRRPSSAGTHPVLNVISPEATTEEKRKVTPTPYPTPTPPPTPPIQHSEDPLNASIVHVHADIHVCTYIQ